MPNLNENGQFIFWSRIASLVGALTAPLATLVVMMLFQRLSGIEDEIRVARMERTNAIAQIARMQVQFETVSASLIRIEGRLDKQEQYPPLKR